MEKFSRAFRSTARMLRFLLGEILRAIALRIPTTGKTVAREGYRTLRNLCIAGVVLFIVACLLLGANQIATPIYESYRQPSVTRQLERKLELKRKYRQSRQALQQQWEQTPTASESLWSSIQKIAD